MLKLNGVDFILNYFFNFGSFLGLIFLIQVFSGLLLSLYYEPSGNLSFSSIQYLMIEVNKGWLVRLIHFNMVSLFFMMIMMHMLKALFYFSYRLSKVWNLGLLIFLMLMLEAFLGYILIWSQMSFWAATVITSLISVIPIFGDRLIIFFWGGYYLNSFSLKFFFVMHFILPLLIFVLIFFHLIFLHYYSSSNNLFNSTKFNKRSFFPFYWVKDFINLIFIMFFFLFFFFNPFKFNESLSFVFVNNLVSPIHIVPEWYFLWAYAILRAFSIKWIGVLMMLLSVLVFFLLKKSKLNYDLISFVFIKFFCFNFFFLIWLGSQEPVFPFVNLSLFFSVMYFILLM
uniref:Cytochrome b n=3 Tax=Meloidogyne enterolobii TaxID=390850 RepID=A0A0C5AR02_MELEN|nr:cytochrome b [Meloidogyne enterolobii]AJK90856.1 cytochrome b [Meloidogyne enterolobii]